ncbi:MAG: hypothetical protein ACJ8EY_10755 [Sphingomicrobium sp.]
MRIIPALIIASAIAAPAAAQGREAMPAVPPQLTDPAMADKLANMMQVLSKAFLNMPVGEVQAAVEGRPATTAEKRMTVRDMARRDDPDFDRHFQQQIAGSRDTMRAGMKAMSAALPAMMKGLGEARDEIEKGMANMPSPTYPNR